MIDASEFIPFGEWLPDLGSFQNPGALTVKNCIPVKGRYKPFYEFVDYSDALADDCKGAIAYRDASGTVSIFAATKEKIYKLSNGSWTDVTRASGGDYSTGDDGFWDFVSYGNLVIATNYTDDMQVFNVATDSEFSQLSATAPRCRRFFVLKNFLVCLDVVDSDGSTSYRVRWSPLADPEGDWTSLTLSADFQDILGESSANYFGVSIQDVGYIFQDKNIFRMEFVGGSDIFRFEKVEQSKGTIYNRGGITNGRDIYYVGDDGFYRFDGVSSTPIGDGKVDDFFAELIDLTYAYNLNMAVDVVNKNIYIAFPSISSDNGTPDYLLSYNWADKRWTYIEEETHILFNYLTATYTLEQLDNISSSIDALEFSLDSRVWKGGNSIFGAFNNNNKLGSFDGAPKTATIGSTEIRPNRNGKAEIHSIIPYVEGDATVTARLGLRDGLGDGITWTDFINKNSITGEFDFHRSARFMRVEFELSGNWEKAVSFAHRSQLAGDI